MKNITKYILISGYCLLLILPDLAMVFDIEPPVKLHDKRFLTTNLPPLNFKTIMSFPDAFTEYYNDSHGFRKFLIYWNIVIQKKYFKLPIIKNVLTGKDGWFFWGGDEELQIIRTTKTLTSEELNRIKQINNEKYEYCKRMGARYIFLIPPSKHTIYPEYLPDWIHEVKKQSHFEQIITMLKSDPNCGYIDFREALLNAKEGYPLYYKTDTHWNTLGAFVSYQTTMKEIIKWFPNIKYFDFSDFTIQQTPKKKRDLLKILGLEDTYLNQNPTLVPRMDYSSKRVMIDPFYRTKQPFYPYLLCWIFETPNPELPKAVVFHDSAMFNFLPYLSNHFRRIVYIYNILGNNYFDTDIIEYEKPDIVITETSERYVLNTPDNPTGINGLKDFETAFINYLNRYSDLSQKKWKIYWNTGKGFYAAQRKKILPVWTHQNEMHISLELPPEVTGLRINPPPGFEMNISNPLIYINTLNRQNKITLENLDVKTHSIKKTDKNSFIVTGLTDPFFSWSMPQTAVCKGKTELSFSASIYPAFFPKINTENFAKDLEDKLIASGKKKASVTFRNLWNDWSKKNNVTACLLK